jgi:hypothetical protein
MVLGCVASALAADAPPPAPGVRPEPLKDLGRANKVRLVYFVPTDREPTPQWKEKIGVVAAFVADLYRRDLQAHGCRTRGLDFEFDAGALAVHLVRGKEAAAHYTGDPQFDGMQQWRTVVPEVEKALGPASRNLYVVFAETYDDGPTKFEWRGGVALGARYTSTGGVGLFSAWILRDELCSPTVDGQLALFADETPIKGRVALGCGRMDSPRFEFIEDGFGAVAHEMGHTFGLPHDMRQESRYVMGNGFRNLRRNYVGGDGPPVGFSADNARILCRSRFLAEDFDAADAAPPAIRIASAPPVKAGATEVPLDVVVTDAGHVAAILYFVPAQDSVVGGAALAGQEVRIHEPLAVRAVPADAKTFAVIIIAVDAGGNVSTVKAEYPVEKH